MADRAEFIIGKRSCSWPQTAPVFQGRNEFRGDALSSFTANAVPRAPQTLLREKALWLGIEVLVVIFALGCELHAWIGAGLEVFENFAFLIPNHDFLLADGRYSPSLFRISTEVLSEICREVTRKLEKSLNR